MRMPLSSSLKVKKRKRTKMQRLKQQLLKMVKVKERNKRRVKRMTDFKKV